MRVLVTGGSGQLGRALLARAPQDMEVLSPERGVLDLADQSSIENVMRRIRPDLVINAGAYTAVDKAESDREQAHAINAHAPGVLAKECHAMGAALIHVSTDFVFDGTSSVPYASDAQARPLSVYGETKLAGERAVRAISGLKWSIVRTAWVYASQGRNFVLTMLRLFRERDSVSVVADQIGTPTSAPTLAQCIWSIAKADAEQQVYHFTDAGAASWYDFAVAIYEEARALGLLNKDVTITPIATEQYPTPAKRPSYSVLDKRSTWSRLQLAPEHWRIALRRTLQEIRA